MNFNYEQVMDMGFPVPTVLTTASRLINNEGVIVNWYENCPWLGGDQTAFFRFEYLPSQEEVYNFLRSGLFLKCLGRHERLDNFQFWLTNIGFQDSAYATGQDLCEALCNAYIRGKHRPTNPK